MLKKSHITNVGIYTDEWNALRLARFTSSKAASIVSTGEGAWSYVYQKVGEAMTGISNDKEFRDFDEDLEWGLKYEPESINEFGSRMGVDFLVTQKLILVPDGRFASTPDGLIVHGECKIDTTEYHVSTVEGKCPRTYHWFMKFCMCDTPADVKKAKAEYYWQVLDQMDQCGAAVGYFYVYHPYFDANSNMKIIKFSKMDLWDDFRVLSKQKKLAVERFEGTLSKMKGLNQQNSLVAPKPAMYA